MANLEQIGISTAQTIKESVVLLAHNKRILIPRTSLAIFNGLNAIYPGEIGLRGRKNALSAMSDLAPVLIALNEVTDVGFSAERKNAGEEASLLLVKLNEYLRSWTDRFVEKHPGHKDTIRQLVNDFCLLSLVRNTIRTDQIPQFLELDSIIFEVACARIATQKEWRRDSKEKWAMSFEDLVSEYGDYLICNEDIVEPVKESARKLRSIHALEMVMKIRDDSEGVDIDKQLGIPNFYEYARVTAGGKKVEEKKLISDLRDRYIGEAEKGGFSRSVITAIELLQHFSGLIKDKRAKKQESLGLFKTLPQAPETTTTLRHKLMLEPEFVKLLGQV